MGFCLITAETVYHSSSVLSNLSSSWTSKPPLAVKYRLDTGSLIEPGGPRSLCSTVERLLAWEKKLYDEVKVSFAPQIEWLWFLSEKLELLFYNFFFNHFFISLSLNLPYQIDVFGVKKGVGLSRKCACGFIVSPPQFLTTMTQLGPFSSVSV